MSGYIRNDINLQELSSDVQLVAIDAPINQQSGVVNQIVATGYVATIDDARRIVESFPKSLRLHASTLTSYNDGASSSYTVGMIRFTADLTADAVNGGINEAGIKRYRAFRKHLAKRDIAVSFTRPEHTAWSSLRLADEAQLDAQIGA